MTAMATHQMKKSIEEIGVPEVPEFLQQIVDSGGHLWACRMSADMQHLQHKAVTTTDRLSSEAATGGTRWSRPSQVQLAC